MNWTVQCAEYYLYRGVSRTSAYGFMQQSGVLFAPDDYDRFGPSVHSQWFFQFYGDCPDSGFLLQVLPRFVPRFHLSLLDNSVCFDG